MDVTLAPPSAPAPPPVPHVEPVSEPEPRGTSLPEAGERNQLVVACAQIAPRLGDVQANLGRHLEVIRHAADWGADLVVFPELSLTGYFLEELVPDVALRLDSAELARLAAASTSIDVIAGCVLEGEDFRFHNAALHLAAGAVAHVHRKVYLPTYGLFDDARYFAPGDRFRTFSIASGGGSIASGGGSIASGGGSIASGGGSIASGGASIASGGGSIASGEATPPAGDGSRSGRTWRAGILLCEDMWHPSAPALLARQGVDVIICPSASPGRGVTEGAALGTERSYDQMTRTYAQLFTSYLVYCNRVGYEDGVAFWGGSRVVDPGGSLSASPAGDGEELTFTTLELGAVRRARIIYPLLRDERHDVNDSEAQRLRDPRARD